MKTLYLLLFMMISSCEYESTKPQIEQSRKEPGLISLLISRGGRKVPVELKGKNVVISDSVANEMYLFEIRKDGSFVTTFGFGSMTMNTISLNQVDHVDSLILSRSEVKQLFSLADKLYAEKEYVTKRTPTDSWLCKLKLNGKTYVYYRGDSYLDKDYLYIVDEIVEASSLKPESYPN